MRRSPNPHHSLGSWRDRRASQKLLCRENSATQSHHFSRTLVPRLALHLLTMKLRSSSARHLSKQRSTRYSLAGALVVREAQQRVSMGECRRLPKDPLSRTALSRIPTPARIQELQLAPHLDAAAETLRRVDTERFFSRFRFSSPVEDDLTAAPIVYFYEPFLEAFDPELRKELGVWYTPPEIVRYQVKKIDRILREELAHSLRSVMFLQNILGEERSVVGVLSSHDNTSVQPDDLRVTISYYGPAKGAWRPTHEPAAPWPSEWGGSTGDLYINDRIRFVNVPEGGLALRAWRLSCPKEVAWISPGESPERAASVKRGH